MQSGDRTCAVQGQFRAENEYRPLLTATPGAGQLRSKVLINNWKVGMRMLQHYVVVLSLCLASPAWGQAGVDAQVVGTWVMHDNNGNTYYWIIAADGTYRFYGEGSSVTAPANQGRIAAVGGRFETVTTTGVQSRGVYKFYMNLLVTSVNAAPWVYWTREKVAAGIATSTNPSQALQQGVALKDQRRFDQAIQVLSTALRVDPNLQQGYFQRGICLIDIAVERQPVSRETAHILGDPISVGRVELVQMAVDDFNRALRLNPKDARAWCMRGKANMTLGQYKQAIGDYSRAIDIDRNYAWAYGWRGYVRTMEGEDASADMQRCYGLDQSLREYFADYMRDAEKEGQATRKQMARIVANDAAMQDWQAGHAQALQPWGTCGQLQQVTLKFHTGTTETPREFIHHYAELTMTAYRVEVKAISTLPPFIAWVPVRKADADAIPSGYRIEMHAPPGVAAYDPGNWGMGIMTGTTMAAMSRWLDTMFATRGEVR